MKHVDCMLMGVTGGSTQWAAGLRDSDSGRICDGYRDADDTHGKGTVGFQATDGVDKEGAVRMSLLKQQRKGSRLGRQRKNGQGE